MEPACVHKQTCAHLQLALACCHYCSEDCTSSALAVLCANPEQEQEQDDYCHACCFP